MTASASVARSEPLQNTKQAHLFVLQMCPVAEVKVVPTARSPGGPLGGWLWCVDVPRVGDDAAGLDLSGSG